MSLRLRGSSQWRFRRVGYKTYWYGWDGKKGRFLRIHRSSACFYFDHWSASIQYDDYARFMRPFFVWKPKGTHLLFGRGNISYHRDLGNLHSLLLMEILIKSYAPSNPLPISRGTLPSFYRLPLRQKTDGI